MIRRFALSASIVLLLLLLPCTRGGAELQTLEIDHVSISYDGVTEAQARSLARVAEAARASALKRFGFDVPETIRINVDSRAGNTVRLLTDGQDTYTLSLRSSEDLAPPVVSGVRNLYGMCHELGHVVMYRVLKERRWLSNEACEGWAHYFGSQVVEDVFAAHGQEIWWTPYDYRSEGMLRLKSDLASKLDDKTVQAAGLWMELVAIVGETKVPALLAGWESARIDPTDPAPEVQTVLRQFSSDAKLDAWWARAQPVLIQSIPRSPLAAGPTSKPATAAAAPTELAIDDGKAAGKTSIAGSGHAVSFESPGEGCVLLAVKIFGSRYGAPDAPAEDFHVYLCDSDGKQIADLPFPYKTFIRGGQRWVTLKLDTPQPLPRHFIICVSFNPTATKGVFVHYDKSADGDSRTGLPGKLNDAFEKGDWMIRAEVAAAAKP